MLKTKYDLIGRQGVWVIWDRKDDMNEIKDTGKYLLFLRRVRFDFLVQQHTELSEWTRNFSIVGKIVQM